MNNKPFLIKDPKSRWAPGQEQLEAFDDAYEKLLPPLVHKVRKAVTEWRDSGYPGVTDTTKLLLNYWFETEHETSSGTPFQFYFSQRESMESIIYLYEVAKARDKYELIKFDGSGRVSAGMFDESWTRYVVKMATGTGKTKVLALTLVWSYFNSYYEEDSPLTQNFLVIAPNIIVLNRIRKDFDGLKMFFEEPFFPDDGYDGRDWRSNFQLTVHIQDDLKPIAENGNIFLTNIHRVYMQEEQEPSVEEIFLGSKPKADADTSRGLDLSKVLRSDRIKDLMVLNDEAHHVHDATLQWFKSIEDISNKLKLKTGKPIVLQTDFTATPKHNNGAIFVQTIADYPLVEAIRDNVVKSPVLPDEASRLKLEEKDSNDFLERYKDFIHLGYLEWKRQYEDLKSQKTPILFIMTMSTKEADEAAEFLENEYPILKDSVLTIHTNSSGELKENVKNKQDEIEELRKAANKIDSEKSPYKAVSSVLMLREGWDVKNVATIVGLRPFNADSQILPEQAIGRGLRKMFSLDIREKLTVIGTNAFIEFVESLKTEGVEFQYSPMGEGSIRKNPIIIEVDKENEDKDLDELDIPIPQLSPRVYREYKNLDQIDLDKFTFDPALYKTFDENELKEIVFKDIDDNVSHKTIFKDNLPDYRNVIGFFVSNILKDNRLFGGFDILYPKVEEFVHKYLFGKEVELQDAQTIRNLSEAHPKAIIYKSFKEAINDLTIMERGDAEVRNYISLKDVKPKVTDNQKFIIPKKSIFNKVIGDNDFELKVAAFFENRCEDIIAFAKNTMGEGGVNFKMEYQAEDGNIRDYFPDFFVKKDDSQIFIVETKGREDLNDLKKINRLVQWCKDVNSAQDGRTYTPLYIKQEEWEQHEKSLRRFSDLESLFTAS